MNAGTLLVGVLALAAVLVISAAITAIAPYLAIGFCIFVLIRFGGWTQMDDQSKVPTKTTPD